VFVHGGGGGRRVMMMNAMMASTKATTSGSMPLFAWMRSRVCNVIRKESAPMSTTYKLNNTRFIEEQKQRFLLKTLSLEVVGERRQYQC